MRGEVGIWSTVFLWINLIYYWIKSPRDTAGMEGAGRREIWCNNSSACNPARMTRSFNQRWDCKLKSKEHTGYLTGTLPKRGKQAFACHHYTAVSSKRRSLGLHHAALTLHWAWGMAMGVIFRPRWGNSTQCFNVSWGNKAYGERHLGKTRQSASWLEEQRTSPCLLETWEPREWYFILGNVN